MKIIEAISHIQRIKKGCVLSIGNFDGVHLGHQQILADARKISRQNKSELIVMTFEPHPVTVLHKEKAPGVLTPLAIKKHLLANCGADCLIVLQSSRQLLSLSPRDFIVRFLSENIRPGVIVEGDDFNFGFGRAGSIDTLKDLGSEKGFEVSVIKPRNIKLSTGQTVRISSTMIRYMLEAGHVADARSALGRPYRLIEKIIPGRGAGKKLGFPTLNLNKPDQVIPAEGVYAGFAKIGENIEDVSACEEMVPAVYSIGQARTYGDEFPLLIEAHLLDVKISDDMAGRYMAMDFIRRIRSQHKFVTPQELSRRIAIDCEQAKKILNITS